jgi:ubiquinone biosynthesis protein
LRAERLVAKLERATDRGFALHPESVAAIGRAEGRRSRWQAGALWVLALCAVVLIWRSMT